MRLLRIAWDLTQEQLLPDGRVAIYWVERGQNKLTSARLVSAYCETIGAPALTLRAYADGHQSLRWLIARATNPPPAGWEARIAKEEARATKLATAPECSGATMGDESTRRIAIALGLDAERVLEALSSSEGNEMQRIESEVVRRAARAAAELEGVPYEVAARCATRAIEQYPELTSREDMIDHWCKTIRDRIGLTRSGAFRVAPEPRGRAKSL